VLVDSYRFLPRSFLPLYQHAQPLPNADQPVWAPFEQRLAGATVALLTSAGIAVTGEQPPFDLDGERADPTWGDPSHREIPHGAGPLQAGHLHINTSDIDTDPEVALPMATLDALVAEGVVKAAAAHHFSVMGYQRAGLEVWRTQTAPAIVERLRSDRVDGLILAPV
jgi:hypothetical protein